MPQVMEAHVRQARPTAHPRPGGGQAHPVLPCADAVALTGKHERRGRESWPSRQHVDGGRGQQNRLAAGLRIGEVQRPTREVDLCPPQRQDLPDARARQQQEPNRRDGRRRDRVVPLGDPQPL